MHANQLCPGCGCPLVPGLGCCAYRAQAIANARVRPPSKFAHGRTAAGTAAMPLPNNMPAAGPVVTNMGGNTTPHRPAMVPNFGVPTKPVAHKGNYDRVRYRGIGGYYYSLGRA